MKHNALNKGLAELVTREFDSRSSFSFLFVIRHARDARFNLISLPLLFPSLEKFYTFPHEQNLYNDINLNIEATHSCPSSIDSSSREPITSTLLRSSKRCFLISMTEFDGIPPRTTIFFVLIRRVYTITTELLQKF